MNKEIKKEKKKVNKKVLSFVVLGVLALALVSAIGYYALFSVSFTVQQSIILSGDCNDNLGIVHDGSTVIGKKCTLTNNALSERDLVIRNNASDGIKVSYMGSLTMVEKNTATWETLTGNTETIQYTVVGDEFVVEGIPAEYTLIYYPNLVGGWYTGISNDAIVLTNGVNEIVNLPDVSIDVGDDYCNILNSLSEKANSDATQCVGAKLWLILGDTETALAKLDSWNMVGTLFETELIQYNANGEITLSPGASLTITPIYKIGAGVTGLQTIKTTVA